MSVRGNDTQQRRERVMNVETMREKLASGNKAVIMIGISGSGKSTLASDICPANGMVVSTDAMRALITGDPTNQKCSKEAFQLAHKMWESRLKFGQTTVFDATSTTTRARNQLLDRVGDSEVIVILVDEDLSVCKARNASRERMVPEWVLDRQHSQLEDARHTIANPVINVDLSECWRYTSENGFTPIPS